MEPFYTEKETIDYVLKKYRNTITENPELFSLLYDINLLPEQIQSGEDARKLQAICMLFEDILAKDKTIERVMALLK